MNLASSNTTKVRRGRPSPTEAMEKRASIITAATQLFLSDGYQKVSMRKVAEHAEVSTRTLYNLYTDKTSLFIACLDALSPRSEIRIAFDSPSLEATLRGFAVGLVRMLLRNESLGFARLVMNDGKDHDELAKAGFDNQERHLVIPLAAYFEKSGLSADRAYRYAKIFIAMAITDWNRSVTFHLPLPDDDAIRTHAEDVTRIFLNGAPELSQQP